ncbi:MAG: hypothetical protein H0V66_09340 [Bdellovibrionales bacterium]|nr:hypothetical protein [Bdellovibrionales bacterium]
MAGIVYILCALTSFSCAVMLFLGYRKNKFRLLLWSSIGFSGFFLNNILLFIDVVILPNQVDLSVVRTIPALMGMIIMVYGLIEETA